MRVNGFPLAMAGTGRVFEVTVINGGSGMKRKLSDMGLVPGTPLRVISGCYPGPLLIEIKGSRLGLGYGIAHKVMVKETANG